MLLALFAIWNSKHTKSDPILHFRTVFRRLKMTRSRKQPVFDTKRKIYFKARFKYILLLFRPPGTRCTFSNQAAVVGCSAKLFSRMRVFSHTNSVYTKCHKAHNLEEESFVQQFTNMLLIS
jgi:hypothetical protein